MPVSGINKGMNKGLMLHFLENWLFLSCVMSIWKGEYMKLIERQHIFDIHLLDTDIVINCCAMQPHDDVIKWKHKASDAELFFFLT